MFCTSMSFQKNIGDTLGSGTIWSEFVQKSNHYTKSHHVLLNAGETDSYTFRYTEIDYWFGGDYSYRVWAEND